MFDPSSWALAPLLAPLLAAQLVAAQPVAASDCGGYVPPRIDVQVVHRREEIKQDYTIRQLQYLPIDTAVDTGHATTHVSGIMAGDVRVSTNVGFNTRRWPMSGEACLSIEDVTVEIEVVPVIQIARDYRPGSCEYAAVLDHERRHVRVDRMVAEAFVPRYRSAIASAAASVGVIGPDRTAADQRTIDRAGRIVHAVIDQVSASLFALREQQQQAVDTEAEYRRVTALCQNWVSLR